MKERGRSISLGALEPVALRGGMHQRRLEEFWAYLPAFRAVAETLNISAAAKLMFVTPSAISRAISNLESAAGVVFFVRHSGGVSLTAEGLAFLDATRIALRAVDDAVGRLGSRQPTFVIGAIDEAQFMVGHAIGRLESIFQLHILPILDEAEAGARLLRGELDFAIVRTDSVVGEDGLAQVALGEIASTHGPRYPVAAAVGMALAGQVVQLPLELSHRLGLSTEIGHREQLMAIVRSPGPQGKAYSECAQTLIGLLQSVATPPVPPEGR